MSGGILSRDLLGVARETRAAEPERVVAELRPSRTFGRWDPERFAWEQICGLVRQIFSASMAPPVRQVVFSAVEAEIDVHPICMRVGESLSRETQKSIAITGGRSRIEAGEGLYCVGLPESGEKDGSTPLRRGSTRVRSNVWTLLPPESDEDGMSMAALHSHMAEVRREFEYSIVEGPPAGESDEAMAMAQFADGIILVLSAQHTRRMAALKIRRALAVSGARLLGTVLTDREFPIPERIYRRL